MSELLGGSVHDVRKAFPNERIWDRDLGLGLRCLRADREAGRLDLLVHDGDVAQIRTGGQVAEDPQRWLALHDHRDALLGSPPPVEEDPTAFDQAAFDLLADPYDDFPHGGAVFGVAARPLPTHLAFQVLASRERLQAVRALLRCLQPVARIAAAGYLRDRRPILAGDAHAIDALLDDPVTFEIAPGGCIVLRGTARDVLEQRQLAEPVSSGRRRRSRWRRG